MMVKPKLIIALLSLLPVCCASVSEMRKMEKFEETSMIYETAIRWSDFDNASTFLNPQESQNISAKIEELKQFKVTSYTIKRFLPAKDKSQVLIIAEIKYFRITNLVVKSVSDRQLWKYDIAEKRWYLTSGLPDFN
jgi:hypothetical protein